MECIWPSTCGHPRKFNYSRVGNFDSHLFGRLSKIFTRISDPESIFRGSSVVSYRLD
jgi:hypothetical protein